MNNSIAPLALILALAGAASQAQAGTTALADWCVNLNGDINTACNGAGSGGVSPGGGSIDLSGFDPTLEPALNNLGSVVVNLVAGENNQFAAFYADYDLDWLNFGAFQDSGSISEAPPAGIAYELDDPNISAIFTDFSSDTLADTNNVGTPSGPNSACCDVAFALSVGDLDVPTGDTGAVTFTISDVAPASGFYIQQTNFDVGDSIYLTESVDISGVSPATPEPSTFALGLLALSVTLAVARRRRLNA